MTGYTGIKVTEWGSFRVRAQSSHATSLNRVAFVAAGTVSMPSVPAIAHW
jgi:hypothetical protein